MKNENNLKNQFKKIVNKAENIDILLRLYCFEEEIKGKISNYEKITVDLQPALIINKNFIDKYKEKLDYKNICKKLKNNINLFNDIKDGNGIINSDKLEENNNLSKIKKELNKMEHQLVAKINSIKIEMEDFKRDTFKLDRKEIQGLKQPYIDEIELISPKIDENIKQRISQINTLFCQYILGEHYLYLLILNTEENMYISEIVKLDKNYHLNVEYVLNFDLQLKNDVIIHIKQIGVDNMMNYIKNNDKNDLYTFDKLNINYYNVKKNYSKSLNNDEDKNTHKNKIEKIFANYKQIKENDFLPKLLFLYYYYSDMNKIINSKEISVKKMFLINYKSFLDIKTTLDYDNLKVKFDKNENIKTKLKKIKSLDEIIKLLQPEIIEKYKKPKIKIDENMNIEPEIIAVDFPNQNEKIMIYNKFEIFDKILLDLFFAKTNKILEHLEAECLFNKRKIIINLPQYLNDKKYISLIGYLDHKTKIFTTSYISVYYIDTHQKEHINYIINNDLDNYLQSLKEECTIIRYKEQILGKIIKNKIEKVTIKEEPIKIGLQNIGATCYMNATLQCFMHIKAFVDYFRKGKKKLDVISDPKTLSYSFKKLINNLFPNKPDKKKTYYAPNEFKEKISKMNPLFEGIAANDSKDLINFIIMTLHEELNIINNNISISNEILDQSNKEIMFQSFMNDFKQKHNSLASELFYGVNYNITACTQCSISLYNYQIYFFLIFPLEEVRKFVYQNSINNQFNQFNQINQFMNNNNANNMVDIYQCFEYDRRINLMSGDNAMFCNKCQKSTPCNICTKLVFGPKILIIILNRGKGKQFDVKLNFNEELNLGNYIEKHEDGVDYKLIGVITHLGESGMGGHFIAFCKDPLNNLWYKFNDAIVSKVDNFKGEVIDFGMPYLLFYQKKNN